MKNIIRLTRPYQWIKNGFIFLPIFFGGELAHTESLIRVIIAFIAYCFTASAIYCFNDIIDVEDDRRHSVKCKRPIAAGEVTITQGYTLMALLILLSAGMLALLAYLTPGNTEIWIGTASVIACYFILDIAYCCILKHYAIVDICVLSMGFVLRIIAGSYAADVVPSQWIVLMTFLISLFLALAKRRDDVIRMKKTGEAPRHNTHRYNMTFINQSITITAAVMIVCYIMYTISPEVTARTDYDYQYLTTIFVLLGLLRYIQLTDVDNKSGDPTKLLYSDRFLQIDIVLWLLSYLLIIYVL